MRDPEPAQKTIGRLKRRADFLRVGKGLRWHTPVATVQMAVRGAERQSAMPTSAAGEPEAARIGFTLTRKVGGAVVRNRARRRLKEAIRLAADLQIVPGRDYVLVGRIDAIRRPFDALQRDLVEAFKSLKIEAGRAKAPSPSRPQRIHPAP